MEITITTKQGQIHEFRGTHEALYTNDWNEIIGTIIESEHEYEKETRHQEVETDKEIA